MNESLKLQVEKITRLPTIPVIAQEIMALINDDMTSVNRLVKLIENDPAISSKILSVANSAFIGLAMPAKTLNNAIMRIGFDSIRNIALGISLITVLNNGKHQNLLDYNRVFNHSVAVGLIANLISKRFKFTGTDEILISGMLHDVGLLILSRYFPVKFMKVLDALKKGKSLSATEKEVMGFTHADMGSWLAEKWNLPDTVSDTVRHHHTPSLAQQNLKHISIVHIADYIVSICILRSTEQNSNSEYDPSSLEMLGMSKEDLKDITAEVKSGDFFHGLFTP